MALSILLSIAATLWLWLTFAAAGEAILRCFKVPADGEGLAILQRFGLGFGLSGTLIMLLCFVGLASPPWIVTVVGCQTLAFLPFWRRALIGYIRLGRTLWFEHLRPHPITGGLLAILAGGYACRGLLPPVEFDTLMYHLAVAKLYLQHGGFWNIYFNAQANFPMLTEMNDMIGLALGNDIVCKTLSFVIGLHAFLAVGLCARRYLGCAPHAANIAVLIFATLTNTIANCSTCNVDFAQALWTLIAVLSLEHFRRDGRLPWLLIGALFAGLAIETKVFGAFAIPVVAVQLLTMRDRWKTFSGLVGRMSLLVLPGVVMGIPWFSKSLAYNGTAIAIHHASIVGQGLSRPMNINTTSPLLAFLINVPGRLLAAPWTFSIFPSQHQSDTFGPLFLAAIPLLLFARRRPETRFLLWGALIYLAEILFMEMVFVQGGSSVRYSTFVLMIGSAFVPWIIQQLDGHPAVSALMRIMVVVTIVLGSALFIKRYHREWIALAKNQSRDAYYGAVLPEYAVIKRINELADGKSVMPVYNYDDYLMAVPFVTAYRSYPSTDAMKQDLRSKNVGYLFANNKLDTTENARAFPDLKPKEIIASANGFYIYKLDF